MNLFQRRQNNKIKKIEDELTNLRSFEYKRSKFFHIATHQLKNPLSIIKFILTYLSEDKSIPDLKQKRIKQALFQSQVAIDFLEDISQILNMESRSNVIQNEKMEIEDILKQIILELNEFAKIKKIQIIKHLDGILPEIKTDPIFFKVALSNLIDNAIKYSDENSRIIISAFPTDRSVEISVQDFGIGIAKADQARIFNIFFRGQNTMTKAQHGTGLGLYLVKIIADKLDAKINFESILNKGTTFTLRIPVD